MQVDFPSHFLPLAALYPEIHYRLKFFPFSRYFRREPEIIIDAPHRLEPGERLPLLIIVKDADRYPVNLIELKIEAKTKDYSVDWIAHFPEDTIKHHWWYHIEQVDLPDCSPCQWLVSAELIYEIQGHRRQLEIDNISGLSHAPLAVFQARDSLPRRDGWIYGDFHVHTHFTEDQVEFGGLLVTYPIMGKAMGLSFALPGDHSYDLDDLPGNYRQNDPALQRFYMRHAEIIRYNEEEVGQFCIIPGFELSVGNSQGRNVHFLLANQTSFLPGSGDSAEVFFRNRPELQIPEVIGRKDDGCLPIAAHPLAMPSFWEKILLRRGYWEDNDLQHPDIKVLQIWNGHSGRAFREGLTLWVNGLLEGRHWRIIAGSDAHGFFNRARHVTTPFWKIAENNEHIYGKVRTGLLLKKQLMPEDILDALLNSRSFITNGPFLDLEVIESDELKVECLSSDEFGEIADLKVFWGKKGLQQEELIFHSVDSKGFTEYKTFKSGKNEGYFRAVAQTTTGLEAYTNPVFITAWE